MRSKIIGRQAYRPINVAITMTKALILIQNTLSILTC